MRPAFDPRRALVFAAALAVAALACSEGAPAGEPTGPAQPTVAATEAAQVASVFDLGRTTHGFFPSPPEGTLESVLNHFKDIGEHADFILVQPNIPWEDFRAGVEGESQGRTDLRNQTVLTRQNGLEWV
jgi:hypothetical protein